MPTDNSVTIDPTCTVHELIQSRPETAAVLRQYGIDACCGGSRTLTDAAKAAAVDAPILLRALEEVSFDRTG